MYPAYLMCIFFLDTHSIGYVIDLFDMGGNVEKKLIIVPIWGLNLVHFKATRITPISSDMYYVVGRHS